MTQYLQPAHAQDGAEIEYSISGDGPGRVALVHSLAMDRSFWASVAQQLEPDAQILVPDCRGHGRSAKPAGPYRVEQFAADLAAVLDHAGWADAVVAGASMGGCVALAFAGLFPARCSGLGLFDTTAWYGPDAPKVWEERAQKALTDGLLGLVAFQTTRWFSYAFRQEHPGVVEHCLEVFLANDLAAYAETCRMLGAADLRGLMPRVAAPTRILVGEEDHATPRPMAEALHAGIAGSDFAVIENARHLSPLERPDRIANALRQLLGAAPQKQRTAL
jgi:3-oxoadipate enol-lactonase